MGISVARFVAPAFAAAVGAVVLSPSPAHAQELPSSINEPPHGSGTPEAVTPRGRVLIRPGVEAMAALGTGAAEAAADEVIE